MVPNFIVKLSHKYLKEYCAIIMLNNRSLTPILSNIVLLAHMVFLNAIVIQEFSQKLYAFPILPIFF